MIFSVDAISVRWEFSAIKYSVGFSTRDLVVIFLEGNEKFDDYIRI